ncbi:MAG: serine/threonine protein kinase, partial [Planctomycetota bacterium]
IQIIEGVSLKEKMLEQGIQKSLGEIMLEHKIITSRQYDNVMRVQKQTLLTCKSCGLKYQLNELEVEDIFICEVCGCKVLELSELASLSLEPLFDKVNTVDTAILESQSFYLESIPIPKEPEDLDLSQGGMSLGLKNLEVINKNKYSIGKEKTSDLEGTTKLRFDRVEDESLELLGRVLGSYQIHEKVGEGGSCVVFKATCLHTGATVALKVLKSSEVNDQKIVDRLVREAKVAGMISHPHIVKVLDSGHEDGYYYIVLEYVEGETLREKILQHHTIPIPMAIKIFQQVVQGLAAAHGEGFIHRDIKPDNIMIDQEGNAKITDFGLAKGRTIDAHITQTGQILGTPYYMSPEQAQTSKLDQRSDIYSLGVTMYYALTGRVPFEGATPIEIILKHISTRPIPLSELNPMVPEKLESIIHKMLAKRVEDRYQNAIELLEELKDFSHIHALCPFGHPNRFAIEKGGTLQHCQKCGKPMVVPLYSGQRKEKTFGYPDWKDFLLCKIGVNQGFFPLEKAVEALKLIITGLRYGLTFNMENILPFFSLSEAEKEALLEAFELDIDLKNYPFLFGQIALSHGLITEKKLLAFLLSQKEKKLKLPLGEILVQKKIISRSQRRHILQVQKEYFRSFLDQKLGYFLVAKRQIRGEELPSLLETLKKENKNEKNQSLLGLVLEQNLMNESILDNLVSRFLYQQLQNIFDPT